MNFPPGWTGAFRAARLGSRIYDEIVDFRVDPRGREYLWLGGPSVRHERDPGSDTDAYDEGVASITPLLLDLTSRSSSSTRSSSLVESLERVPRARETGRG